MTRNLIAMFDSRAEAERAAEALRGLNVQVSNVQLRDAGAAESGGQDHAYAAGAAWMPEEDRATYAEGLRRGGAVVTADIAEDDMELAMDAMEAAGAVDLDEREAAWRSQGWTSDASLGGSAAAGHAGVATGMGGAVANPPATMASGTVDHVAGTGTATGTAAGRTAATGEQSIPLAEERLRIGKRVAHAGRVRVRSYVVETPVEEQVRLRDEHVRVERHAVDRPATGSEAELFRDRVIEAEESSEEAVVQKDVRVTGEVVVNKEITEHTETVRDTVRRTEVDVDEESAANDRSRTGGKGVA